MARNGDSNRDACGGCELTKIGPLSELPEETLAALEGMCRVRRFEAGQTLVYAGEEPDFVGCVRQGILRMQKTLRDGRQHIVGLLVEDDMFGRVFDGPLSVDIEAATDAEICTFQRAPFEALLLQSPELDRVVLLNTLNELDRARDWTVILANPRVKGRVAGFLIILCTRFAKVDHLVRPGDGTLEVKIPIARVDLAHLLGTRPESISRALHALAADGNIVVKTPDLIEILDLGAIAAEAGEDDVMSDASLREMLKILKRRA
jgi:CRP/FNR family transcriptional regulator